MATHSSMLARRIPRMSLVGYSPWDHKESDTTKTLSLFNESYDLHVFPPPLSFLVVKGSPGG